MSDGYRTIVCDPPWVMPRGSNYSWREGLPSGERQELDYEQLTTGQIAALDVRSVAARNCHLFLWTTSRYLEESFVIARAWGFSFSQLLVWCKAPHGWGPGGVFQSTLEPILYCRRGRPLPNSHTVDRQWWEWPRAEHSRKPEAFLDMVEARFPGPRLEMFARRARLGGWDYFGNEALGSIELGQAA